MSDAEWMRNARWNSGLNYILALLGFFLAVQAHIRVSELKLRVAVLEQALPRGEP